MQVSRGTDINDINIFRSTIFRQSFDVSSQPQFFAKSFVPCSSCPQATLRTGFRPRLKNFGAELQALLCAFPINFVPIMATLTFFK